MDKYVNRQKAGQALAKMLHAYAHRDDVILLALPRGGVPIAYEIAKELHLPLDVFIVRKLGVPAHKELAFGAIATGGGKVFNEDVIDSYHLSQEDIQSVMDAEEEELKRRTQLYRGKKAFPSVKKKTVILVDDGIATGATMRAAVSAVKQLKPTWVVVAVPVAEEQTCKRLKPWVDQLYCPLRPANLRSVGMWYEDFAQVDDQEVYYLLEEIRNLRALGYL